MSDTEAQGGAQERAEEILENIEVREVPDDAPAQEGFVEE